MKYRMIDYNEFNRFELWILAFKTIMLYGKCLSKCVSLAFSVAFFGHFALFLIMWLIVSIVVYKLDYIVFTFQKKLEHSNKIMW